MPITIPSSQNYPTLESRVDGLEVSKSDVGHIHTEGDITDLDKYTQAEVDNAIEAAKPSINMDNVRYGLVSNPLTHIFKKNKLVDTLSGELTWTRDSVASYVDKYGVVRYAGGNQATNLALWSEDFSNAVWLKLDGGTITPNTDTAPDGTQTADSLDITANVVSRIAQQFNASGGSTYTASVYVKAAAGQSFSIILDSISGTFTTANTVIVTNGKWQRLSATITLNSDNTGLFFSIGSSFSNQSIFSIWGAQLEQSRAANGYLKTEATAITTPTFSSFGVDVAREEKEGWLIEGGGTNFCSPSEDMSQAPWQPFEATVTPNATEAPDGTMTADAFVESTTPNAFHDIEIARAGLGPSQKYTVSIFVKANGRQFIDMQSGRSANITDNGLSAFDIVNGIVTRNDNGLASIQALGDGWFRCAIVAEANANVAGRFITLRPRLDGDTNSAGRAYTGDGVSGFFMWGAQMENSPFPTSYIPTTTESTSVTRAVDLVSMQQEGNQADVTGDLSFALSMKAAGRLPGLRHLFYSPVNETSSPVAGFFSTVEANSQGLLIRQNNGVSTNDVRISYNTDDTFNVAYTVLNNELKSYLNGSLQDQFSKNVNITNRIPSTFNLGSGPTGIVPLYGHIQDFRIYDFALNADEIAFLAGE